MKVSEIIRKLGGIRPLARRLGLPSSTVQSWGVRALIPAHHQRAILNIAKEQKKRITAADLIPDEQEAA